MSYSIHFQQTIIIIMTNLKNSGLNEQKHFKFWCLRVNVT